MPGHPKVVKNKKFLNIQMVKNQFEIKDTVLFPTASARVEPCMPSSHTTPVNATWYISALSWNYYALWITHVYYTCKVCGLIIGENPNIFLWLFLKCQISISLGCTMQQYLILKMNVGGPEERESLVDMSTGDNSRSLRFDFQHLRWLTDFSNASSRGSNALCFLWLHGHQTCERCTDILASKTPKHVKWIKILIDVCVSQKDIVGRFWLWISREFTKVS